MRKLWKSMQAWLLAGAALFGAAAVMAQEYPSRPITLVVPYQAGGSTDLLARLISVHLGKTLGTSVIVENKPGADTRIGSVFVARAAPDGYTVLLNTTPLATWSLVFKNPGIHPQKDLAPVSNVADGSLVLAASAKASFQSFPDMLSYARSHPGKLNFGAPGVSDPVLYMEAIKAKAGIDVVYIPFKGAEQNTALVRGDVQLAFLLPSRVRDFEKLGQAKPLAVTGRKRVPELPNVPTFQELGYEGFESFWNGLFVPASTPRSVIDKLHHAVVTLLKDPEVQERLKQYGLSPVGSTPEELARALERNIKYSQAVADAAGIKPTE